MTPRPRKYDLYSDAFRADTYGTFARMRDEDPVLCQPGVDGETPIWFVTRYDDAEAVLLDDERFVRDPRLALSGAARRGAAGVRPVHRQQHAEPRR
jgi:cytochrome P450